MSPEGVKLRWDHPAAATLGQKCIPEAGWNGDETPSSLSGLSLPACADPKAGQHGRPVETVYKATEGRKVREWIWKNKCKITNVNKESKHLQVGCSVS